MQGERDLGKLAGGLDGFLFENFGIHVDQLLPILLAMRNNHDSRALVAPLVEDKENEISAFNIMAFKPAILDGERLEFGVNYGASGFTVYSTSSYDLVPPRPGLSPQIVALREYLQGFARYFKPRSGLHLRKIKLGTLVDRKGEALHLEVLSFREGSINEPMTVPEKISSAHLAGLWLVKAIERGDYEVPAGVSLDGIWEI